MLKLRKFLVTLLLIFLVSNSSLEMIFASTSGNVLNGDYVVIVNTNPDPNVTQSTGKISFDSTNEEPVNYEEPTINFEDSKPIDANNTNNPAPISKSYKTGDKLKYRNLDYTCIGVGKNSYVWMENSLKVGYDKENKTDMAAKEMIDVYDGRPYEVLNNLANGNIPYADNSGKLSIMLFNEPGGASGYYAGVPGMTAININAPTSKGYRFGNFENKNGLLVHEGQHSLFHQLTSGGSKDRSRNFLWFDEGLAVASMEWAWGNYEKSQWLNYISGSSIIRNGSALVYNSYRKTSVQDYSMPYLFIRYLSDRYSGKYAPMNFLQNAYKIKNYSGGNIKTTEQFINDLLDISGMKGENGQPLTFKEALQDFYVACVKQDLTGKYSFYGDEGVYRSLGDYPIYMGKSGREIQLSGTAAIVVKTMNGRFTVPAVKGNDIKFIAVNKTKDIFKIKNGNGTSENPYLISTARDLTSMAFYPDAYFKLTANIDASNIINNFVENFNGVLDGAGFTISGTRRPLFDYNHGTIKNLKVVGALNQEYLGAGALIANYNNGKIYDCFVSGTMNPKVIGMGTQYLPVWGTLVGVNYPSGFIARCGSDANVTLSVAANKVSAGNLVGQNQGSLQDIYSQGSLNVKRNLSTTDYIYVGGLVGYNETQMIGTSIRRAYSTTSISLTQNGASGSNLGSGRVIGRVKEINIPPILENIFYLNGQSPVGTQTFPGINGKTDKDMKRQDTYTGWNFNGVWKTSGGYPVFADTSDITSVVASLPNTEYYVGESLELYNATITINGNTQNKIPLTSDMVDYTTFDSSTVGTKIVKCNYRGFDFNISINIKAPTTVSELKVSDQYKGKVSYIVGDKYSQSNLKLTAKFDNSPYIRYITSGFTNNKTNPLTTQDTSVTYTYFGQTVSQNISVTPKAVKGITVVSTPEKFEYAENELLEISDLGVRLSYNDGTTSGIIGLADFKDYGLNIIKQMGNGSWKDIQLDVELKRADNNSKLYVYLGNTKPTSSNSVIKTRFLTITVQQRLYMPDTTIILKKDKNEFIQTDEVVGGNYNITTTKLSGTLPQGISEIIPNGTFIDSFRFSGMATTIGVYEQVYKIVHNATKQEIIVTITLKIEPMSNVTGFEYFKLKKSDNKILPEDVIGIIDSDRKIITLTVPSNITTKEFYVTFLEKAGGRSDKFNGGPYDFRNPQIFTVTSEDGTNVAPYTISVVVADKPFLDTVYVSKNGDNNNDGNTQSKAVQTLDKAFELVKENGTINIVDEITIPSNNTPYTFNKGVTIIGGKLISERPIELNSNGIFRDTNLFFTSADENNRAIYANGYNLTIGDNVNTFVTIGDRNTLPSIYGGSSSTVINRSGNITINSGDYKSIYGGGKSQNSTGVTILLDRKNSDLTVDDFLPGQNILQDGIVTVKFNNIIDNSIKNLIDFGNTVNTFVISGSNTSPLQFVTPITNVDSISLENSSIIVNNDNVFNNVKDFSLTSGSTLYLKNKLTAQTKPNYATIKGNFTGGGTIEIFKGSTLNIDGEVTGNTTLTFGADTEAEQENIIIASNTSRGDFDYQSSNLNLTKKDVNNKFQWSIAPVSSQPPVVKLDKLYVDGTKVNSGDGSTQDKAFNSFKLALDNVTDTVKKIIVSGDTDVKENLTLNKELQIISENNAILTIGKDLIITKSTEFSDIKIVFKNNAEFLFNGIETDTLNFENGFIATGNPNINVTAGNILINSGDFGNITGIKNGKSELTINGGSVTGFTIFNKVIISTGTDDIPCIIPEISEFNELVVEENKNIEFSKIATIEKITLKNNAKIAFNDNSNITSLESVNAFLKITNEKVLTTDTMSGNYTLDIKGNVITEGEFIKYKNTVNTPVLALTQKLIDENYEIDTNIDVNMTTISVLKKKIIQPPVVPTKVDIEIKTKKINNETINFEYEDIISFIVKLDTTMDIGETDLGEVDFFIGIDTSNNGKKLNENTISLNKLNNEYIATFDYDSSKKLLLPKDDIHEVTVVYSGNKFFKEAKKEANFKLEKSMPLAPEIKYTINGKTITILPVTGAIYKFDSDNWSKINEKTYVDEKSAKLSLKLLETDTHRESDIAEVEVNLDKLNVDAPENIEISYTSNNDINYTVTIKYQNGLEYSFDGVNFNNINSIIANPNSNITGYIRYKETDTHNPSGSISKSINLPMFKVKNPTFVPNIENFYGSKHISITTETDGAEIFYTKDGTVPTSKSIKYTKPLYLTTTTTINVIAIKPGMENSEVISKTFRRLASSSSDGSSSDSSSNSNSKPNVPKIPKKDIYYTLKYHTNGGEIIADDNLKEKSSITLNVVPVRDGYKFEGWYEDTSFTEKITKINMNSDITIYANWVKEDPKEKIIEIPKEVKKEIHTSYITGKDGLIRPNDLVTRKEISVMIYRLLPDDMKLENSGNEIKFKDVQNDSWYSDAVFTLSKLGIIRGYEDNTFGSEKNITRAELAYMISHFDKSNYNGSEFFSDIKGHWAEQYINRSASNGWIFGYENEQFLPNKKLTRAEAIVILNRVFDRKPTIFENLHENMNIWEDNLDTSKWYYLDLQEATNTHEFIYDDNGIEKWLSVYK